MNRLAALFAVLALVVAGVAVPAAGSPPAPAEQMDASNGSAEPAAPGARLAGVVAVQGAEVEAELAGRAFGIQVARANSDGARAAVVADRVGALEQRLAAIEADRQAIEVARENGNVSRARYNAEITAIAARSAAVEQQLDRTAAVSATLPDAALTARGVDPSTIDALRTEARDMTGPEVADIARSIAGPGVGRGLTVAGNAGGLQGGPPTSARGSPSGPPDLSDVPDSAGTSTLEESDTPDPNATNATVPVDTPRGSDR